MLTAESLALADSIGYMENVKCTEVTPSVCKLSELNDMYTERLQAHNANITGKVHATR